VGKEKMYIAALHGVAISIFYILVSSILSLGEWFVKAMSEWEGVHGGFPWWAILLLTTMFYPPAFIYYKENQDMVDPVEDLVTAFLLLPILLIGFFIL
jgi:hypothetical protein